MFIIWQVQICSTSAKLDDLRWIIDHQNDRQQDQGCDMEDLSPFISRRQNVASRDHHFFSGKLSDLTMFFLSDL